MMQHNRSPIDVYTISVGADGMHIGVSFGVCKMS